MEFWQAVVLGLVEGASEFLPISSTGHMIIASAAMGLEQSAFLKSFEICIQLGSILAVLGVFYARLKNNFLLWAKLLTGFVPTGILGLTLYKHIKQLFDINVVGISLILGGAVFIILEIIRAKNNAESRAKTCDLEAVTFKQAVLIGLFQSVAMVPGVSRSGASIVGGLLLGLNRRAAAEFSFLLALPTMLAATGYDALKNREILLQNDNLALMLTGGLVAFVSAFVAIKLFLNLIKKISYTPFGIYRIILGGALLALIATGVVA